MIDLPDHIRVGTPVWHERRPGHRSPATVVGEPIRLSSIDCWVVRIRTLNSNFQTEEGEVAIALLSPREAAPAPIPKPERVPPPMSDPHVIEWSVQKIEDKIGSVAVTLAPASNDDRHKITFDVTKEQAAEYAVGGRHVITIGPRTRFWWEGDQEPE